MCRQKVNLFQSQETSKAETSRMSAQAKSALPAKATQLET
jgi:hypothetical protein